MTEDTVIQHDIDQPAASATPIHLWIVGALALLWNAIGATDYVLAKTHNDALIKAMMPELDPNLLWAYLDGYPLWASIGWGLGIWGAVAGTLLLLARSRHAVTAYIVSLIGMALAFSYQLFVGPPAPEDMDDPMMMAVVVVIGVALLLYTRAMRARGVLR